MSRTALLVVLACAAIASGCARADAMLLDPSRTYPPTENVQLLIETPARPFEVIAVIEGEGSQYNNQ